MAVTAARLNIILSATGAKEVISDLNQIDGQVKKAAGGFDAFYDRIGGGAGNALRALDGVARVMGSIAIIGGVSLIAGGARAAWDQVSAVEQATVALRAYEKDASAVDKVLADLIAYARSDMGVLFQRQDLFNAAQGLKMYGAETSRLTDYVKIMSRSVGLGLSTWEDLNRVLGRVGSTGRLTGNDFDYLRAAGFQLDESMRNTNVTFEELFTAMDRGIPANALEGQADTIRGALIRLQTGLRNIGLAFLDVDSETSKFVEGGLGDKLRNALFDARGWIDNFADAAGKIGDVLVAGIEAVENLAAAYRSLPGWMQTVIESVLKLVTAFGALRVASSALSMLTSMTGLGGLAGGVMNLAGSFTAAGGGAVGFRAALTGLLAGINPVTLAVVGVGAALGALALMWGRHRKEAEENQRAVENMTNAYLDLTIARNEALLAGNTQQAAHLDQLRMQVDSVRAESEAVQEYTKVQLANNEITIDQYHEIADAYDMNASRANSLADSQNKLRAALLDTRIDAVALTTDMDNLYWAFMRQEITLDEYIIGMADIADNTARYRDEVDEATDATGVFSSVIAGVNAGLEANSQHMEEARERAAEYTQKLMEIAGMGDPLSQWNLSGNATDMSLLAMNTQQAATALDNVFRIAVGNTNAFAQQAQGVEDWITSLTVAEEGLTRLQELQEAGLITQGEYNAAMDASNEIQAANASIQEDVLAIQAKQAPIIAAHTTALADQLSIIRQLPAEQQMIALGWLDSTTAMQAMEFQTLAVAAATGQLGENGDVVFANMIAGAAQANPYLSAILQDMGLISVGADGTITVHLSGVSEGLSEIDRLTVAMVNMLDLMDDGELNMSVSFDTLGLDDPRKKLEDIEDVVVRTDGSVVTINAELNETGGEGGISSGVDAIVTGIRNHYASNPITIPMEVVAPSGRTPTTGAADALGRMAADITISVAADTSAAEEQMSSLLSQYTGAESASATVTVDANTEAANAELDNLTVRLFGFDGLISTTTLDADASGANDDLDNLADRLSGYRGLTSTTTLEADPSQANTALDNLATRLSGYRGLISTTTLNADPALANNALNTLADRLSGYRGLTSTTTLDANSSSAHEVIRLLMNRLNEVDGSSARVYLYANDYASAAINSVSRALNNLNGRTATTYTNQVNTTTYRSVGGGIRAYADGGIVRDDVVLVGERGPELVALPYGSEVFSNAESMQMLREAASRAPAYASTPRSSGVRGGGTTVNNYYQQDVKVMTSAEWEAYKQKSDRGSQAYAHLSDPDSHNYGGGL